MCCGTERHANALADEGYDVVDVDRSATALTEARRDSTDSENVTYYERDMRDFASVPGRFDAVLCLWQSFGYFDPETNRTVLRQIHDELGSNGRSSRLPSRKQSKTVDFGFDSPTVTAGTCSSGNSTRQWNCVRSSVKSDFGVSSAVPPTTRGGRRHRPNPGCSSYSRRRTASLKTDSASSGLLDFQPPSVALSPFVLDFPA